MGLGSDRVEPQCARSREERDVALADAQSEIDAPARRARTEGRGTDQRRRLAAPTARVDDAARELEVGKTRANRLRRGHARITVFLMARMVALGYGKFVRADRVFAVIPLEADERGDGRRTYVHVEGLSEPIVASRSERAILADVEAALAEAAGVPRRRRRARGDSGQESLGI